MTEKIAEQLQEIQILEVRVEALSKDAQSAVIVSAVAGAIFVGLVWGVPVILVEGTSAIAAITGGAVYISARKAWRETQRRLTELKFSS